MNIPTHISPEVRVRIEAVIVRQGKRASIRRPEPEPKIPTALEDWDDEFERLTGKRPPPRTSLVPSAEREQ